jgi:autotransporter-associated beta strand protein
MFSPAFRAGLLFVAFWTATPRSTAQITFTYDFSSNPSFYTQDRQDAIIRAGDYVRTQFDARGTVNVRLETRTNAQIGSSTLAVGGTSYFFQNGGFTSGIAFDQATTNNSGSASGHQFVAFNSDRTNWYAGAALPVPSGQIDLQSVALHELTHGFPFTSLIRDNGAGLQNLTPGSPDTYSQLARHLRLGTAANAPLLVNPNGTFNTAQVTAADLAGNNIYFHGEMAVAANGGQPVRLAGGGDRSHLHSSVSNAVMLPGIPTGTARRAYQAVELAMLIDMGWNQFFWRNQTGNWADNVSSLANARWANIDGDNMLSPVGTITPNLVLTFAGTGGYTSTNNLGLSGNNDRFLVNRVVLNATAGTSTIASNGTNVLRFDTTIGVTPLIRQQGAGAFNITHPIELTAAGLQLGGTGTGVVSLGGAISGTGGLAKVGSAVFELTGGTANTYTGTTTVSGGILRLAKTPGVNAVPGAVVVNPGGTLRLAAANQIADAAPVTLAGGTLSTGQAVGFSDTVGAFQITAASTIALGTGDHTLTFTGITGTPTAALTVTGWVGEGFQSGLAGRIVFADLTGDPNQTYTSFLSNVTFAGFASQAVFLPVGGAGTTTYELVPVPEPGAVVAVAAGALGIGALARRRRRTASV